ncbi:ABC transporter substrate-binding protein [Bradyrhizobium sp. RDT10]
MTRYSRRTLLKAGAAFAGASAIGSPSILSAQAARIKIGHLVPLTGFLGAIGSYAQLGVKMAAEEINASGGIMGKQIDLMSEDLGQSRDRVYQGAAHDRAGRRGAVVRRNLVRLVADHHAGRRAQQEGVLLDRRALGRAARQDCNRYSFHCDIPNTVMVNAVGTALKQKGMVKGKKFVTLTADYIFGHDLLKAAKSFFSANDATLIGDELIATDVTDFSPYLLKVRQAKPDVVRCNLAGNQVTNLVKQYAEFGFPYPLVGFNLNTGDAWAMGEGNLSGTWPTVWYHTLDNPASKTFVEAFSKKYGKPPENHAWIEYITLKMIAQAITETKSTESDALIAYFEKQTQFDIMKARKAYFRSWDHQLVQEAYPFTVKPKNEMKDKWDMLVLGEAVPAAGAELESIYPTKTQNPCNMKA